MVPAGTSFVNKVWPVNQVIWDWAKSHKLGLGLDFPWKIQEWAPTEMGLQSQLVGAPSWLPLFMALHVELEFYHSDVPLDQDVTALTDFQFKDK